MTKRASVPAPLRVVGIGASAGGLEALRELVARLPVDSGLAFVVLQHLPPSQLGRLAGLLGQVATLPVLDVESGHRIRRDTIMIVPPHTAASISRGTLVLRQAAPGSRPSAPIDGLFASLAEVLGERAIGIVLSGTANDGTDGLRAIQAAGGITLAQDPTTARFDEMPRSAIAGGVVELVLTPAQIGDELAAIARLPPAGEISPNLEAIFAKLEIASGIDFSHYKRSTIERRLARRMTKLHLGSLVDYLGYLEIHADEAAAVYEDLLIHVTEFFRDPKVFERIAADVIPALVRDKPADAPIRVWVPGCSTGEEVYSFAMMLVEHLGDDRAIQLFGTDLSERAIDTARRGRYPLAIAAKVGEARLKRFFHREGTGYRINPALRERCVFVRHDLATDPPFSKLDLVSCRNVLIYLGVALQKRVIPIFHYALNQPGFLVLGPAESIGAYDTLFATVDPDVRIYQRKSAARPVLTFPLASRSEHRDARALEVVRSVIDVQRDVDHVLLSRYGPACVVVDDNLDVVQYRGRAGRYLEPPPGQPQLSLLRMARDGLAGELPLAIQRARRADAPVRQDGVVISEGGRDHRFDLEVIPLRGAANAKHYFLVIFEEAAAGLPTAPDRARRGPKVGMRDRDELGRLQQELIATKEYLASLTAQHLATSEELGIANEELQSTNEELQSGMEELQTAKEELQSTNEELETVNDELNANNALLHEANDDLENVLASVEIAIIIVDDERRVRRFTPKAREVMSLLVTDLGRPIADLQPSVPVPALDASIAEVIASQAIHESEVLGVGGRCYRLQIHPYHAAGDGCRGAVIAFVDITTLRAARDHASAIVETVPTPLVVLDQALHIRSANRAFYQAFDGAVGQPLGRELAAAVAGGGAIAEREVEYGERVLRLVANPVVHDGGDLLVGIVDITERRQLEQAKDAAKRERDAFLGAVSHELRTPLAAILLWAEALRGLGDAPRREHAIDTIMESARAEAELVDDLIELASSQSQALVVTLEAVDIGAITRAAIDTLRPEATAKPIVIETEITAGPMVMADPRRWRQIATQLIANAIKFTPPGGRILVAVTFTDGEMRLSVHDSGPGMSRELVARAFEPFVRADGSSTRPHRGLGIGLTLVRHFVERQGGRIAIESIGRGTTVHVWMPASPAA